MSCTCHLPPLPFGRGDRIRTTRVDAMTQQREVTDVVTTMTWTTYLSEPHAVTLPTVGSGTLAGAARKRGTAPVFRTGQGMRMSSFGDRKAFRLEALMNKSIAPLPTSDVVGVSGIRSWSPPV